MRVSTEVTMRAVFTDEERDVLRRAAYADDAERHFDLEQVSVTYDALVRARAKALQGDTQHGKGNAYSEYEFRAMHEAICSAIESGVPTEEQYEEEPWDDLCKAMEDAANQLSAAESMATRSDLEHRKNHAEGY